MASRFSLVERCEKNPILTACDWPYPVHTVFNPAATTLKDGTTLLLCRAEDFRGISHLVVAKSKNGIDGWEIAPEPTLYPDPDKRPEELWGLEDPRIVFMPEHDLYFITYTAYTRSGPGVAIAWTKDFESFEYGGLIMQPEDKNAALFPRSFDGNYVLLHRPISDGPAGIWLARSPDLTNWGSHEILLPARRGAWWDANRIGLACPPIETDKGWLVFYHGVRFNGAGVLYRVGLALFDLEHPNICKLRGDSWLFGPEQPYELHGDVGRVVFPCGYTLGEDGDTLNLYYGAADTCIALATTHISDLFDWLEEHGSTYVGMAGQPAEITDHLDSKPMY